MRVDSMQDANDGLDVSRSRGRISTSIILNIQLAEVRARRTVRRALNAAIDRDASRP